jgi:hypothetical protein
MNHNWMFYAGNAKTIPAGAIKVEGIDTVVPDKQ